MNKLDSINILSAEIEKNGILERMGFCQVYLKKDVDDLLLEKDAAFSLLQDLLKHQFDKEKLRAVLKIVLSKAIYRRNFAAEKRSRCLQIMDFQGGEFWEKVCSYWAEKEKLVSKELQLMGEKNV